MTHADESSAGSMERIVSVMAGGALVYLGIRDRRPWRYLFAVLGADLLRRGVSGRGLLRRGFGPEQKRWKCDDEKVDEMSMQSFPASDAPAY